MRLAFSGGTLDLPRHAIYTTYLIDSAEPLKATILAQDIDLDHYHLVFMNPKFVEQRVLSDDKVQLFFNFDHEKSFTRFLKWYKEE